MPALIETLEADTPGLLSVRKGDLLTAEELSRYLRACGAKAHVEPYASTSVVRIERNRRYTERFRLGTFACGVRWERVS